MNHVVNEIVELGHLSFHGYPAKSESEAAAHKSDAKRLDSLNQLAEFISRLCLRLVNKERIA